jgi:hypothetical protein
MNTTQNVYIHKTALSGTTVSQVLREGSFVSVHVISQTGPQSYTVSAAGGRFSVTSQTLLEKGSSFTTVVSFRDEKIILTPLNRGGILSADLPVVQNFSTQINADGLIADPQLASYFMSLGLSPDSVTLALFSEMKQLGMKLDPSMLNRARRTAEKFSGKEKEAAEAALILEQKGLPADEDAVGQILGREGKNGDKEAGKRDCSGRKRNSEHKKIIHTADNADSSLISEITDEVRQFFGGIFAGSIPGPESRQGLLTLFNHRGFKDDKESGGSWVQIPFEVSLAGGASHGNGMLRCFFDNGRKKSGKFAVKIDFYMKSYFFVLYYINGVCKKIRFCIDPYDEIHNDPELKNQFYTLLQNIFHGDTPVETEWADSDILSGFCTEPEPVSVVRGNA